MIRTLKFALHYQPANSQAIGYYATQQNAAYNAAVDVLNQEPDLPKRSGRHHPDALNKSPFFQTGERRFAHRRDNFYASSRPPNTTQRERQAGDSHTAL